MPGAGIGRMLHHEAACICGTRYAHQGPRTIGRLGAVEDHIASVSRKVLGKFPARQDRGWLSGTKDDLADLKRRISDIPSATLFGARSVSVDVDQAGRS
jgi:hypothetical protein